MNSNIRTLAASTALVAGAVSAIAAQHPEMPAGMTHEQHQAQMKKDAEVKQRGAAAMGFDQDKTSHHFLLASDGGSIAVGVTDPADSASRDQIRIHLKEIAGEFSRGRFDKPFATHNEMPPGVRTMQQRRKAIAFTYEETAVGARVRISTTDPQAKAAVQAFLRYQIREHATGDPLQ